jgi:hypothetical protein
LSTGRARRKEWAQRYYGQTNSDDGQYELGVAVRGHLTLPLNVVNLVVGILADMILTAITVRRFAGLLLVPDVIKTPGRHCP